MTSKIVKVAAVQAAPVAFDLERSLEKVAKFTAEAAGSGADLVIFPYACEKISSNEISWLTLYSSEGFLSAYPWRYAFDTTIGAREPRGIFHQSNQRAYLY
jgi:nitrilase